MGNICVGLSSRNTYNPSGSPISGTASPSHSEGANNLARNNSSGSPISGTASPLHTGGVNNLTRISQLSEPERQVFLNNYDPMRAFHLDENTPLYRTTQKKFIDKNGRIAGHTGYANKTVNIALYEKLRTNPAAFQYGVVPGQGRYYRPQVAEASTLGTPFLNVMVGQSPEDGRYKKSGDVTVKMRLGDFLEQGGKVYTDLTALASNGVDTALIVTLPKGKKVPVTIVE